MVQFTKVRLSGFKSFIDPTEIMIEPGLTGIVGPNGCGKSNIVDALRWTMGEASAKQMRGGEMDDVIFNGTDNRPARNIAEVSVSLDNSTREAPTSFNDDEDLEIIRRIERDQGSSYTVNGREVRARDVQLLFADSATGAHSTALVSQGRIGALIGAKPTDRRTILEEAAGITGLHSRRHEAELRLRGAETNLERLDDVLLTLEEQGRGLKRQARQASRYRNIGGQIRRQEAMLFHQRWCVAKEDIDAARKNLGEAELRVTELSGTVAAVATKQTKAAADLPDLRRDEAKSASTMQRLLLARDSLDAEEKRLAQARQDCENRLTQIAGDIERERTLSQDATTALARLEEERAAALYTGLKESEAAVAAEESRLEELRAEADKTEKTLTEARTTDEEAREALAAAEADDARLHAEEEALAALLTASEASGGTPLMDEITVEAGYEVALGAALGEDLYAPADEGEPVRWRTLPPYDDDATFPDGVEPLSAFVTAPQALSRRLALTGVVIDDDQDCALAAELKPGQRLVSRDGGLWRWDGFTMDSGADTAAATRLGQRNRLNELRNQKSTAKSKLGELRAHAKEARDQASASLDLERQAQKSLRCAYADLHTIQRRDRLAAIATEKETWDASLQAAARQVSKLEKRQQTATAERGQLNARPQEISAQYTTLQDQIDEAEAARTQAVDVLAKAEEHLGESERRLKIEETSLAEAREDRVRAEAVVEQAQQAMDTLAERITEKLECAPDKVLETAGIPLDDDLPAPEAMEKKLERLLRERDNMGPVNLRAEEETRDIEEQISTLQSEREDLVSAISRLRHGISGLNREGRERLLAAFSEVDIHFQELFVRLFGGGQAHMELVDSDDPLEAGLEIFASPPGKKLQVLSLLSGGEKALTALALLFAVFLTNPAPICVLDEVDAPLDDANVDRFCDLIEEIAHKSDTRFLVVTHHRLTMARVDRLFGVTMMERGVSQIVSVDLQQAEQLHEAS